MEYLNFLSANNLGSHVKMKLNTAKHVKMQLNELNCDEIRIPNTFKKCLQSICDRYFCEQIFVCLIEVQMLNNKEQQNTYFLYMLFLQFTFINLFRAKLCFFGVFRGYKMGTLA